MPSSPPTGPSRVGLRDSSGFGSDPGAGAWSVRSAAPGSALFVAGTRNRASVPDWFLVPSLSASICVYLRLKWLYLLAHRIKTQPPFLQIGDVAQVRGLRAAVTDIHVSIGTLAGANAFQEVFDMVDGELALRLHGDRLRIAAGRSEHELAARDQQLSFGSAHLDTLAPDPQRERGFEGRGPLLGAFQQHVD